MTFELNTQTQLTQSPVLLADTDATNFDEDILPTLASDDVATEESLSFEDLGLAKPIVAALTKTGYTHPTPIQAGAIPPSILGQDLLLSAQTGSGKTAAFVLPILHRLATNRPKDNAVRAVILTPTRELALQVHDSVRVYGSRLKGVFSIPLVGGSPYGGQLRALRKGVQIIVATPGRFIDHLNEGRIDLSKLDTLVLDEADRMLDMGFSEDIETILNATPATRQTIMSSATWDGAVGKIAESFTNNPTRVSIKIESGHIDESVYFCDDFRHKNDIFYEVLNNPEIKQAMIFTATKASSEKLAEEMSEKGYTARYLHGDLPQGKRNRIVSDVKAGKCQFLVATDVAARGIDIASISHVINYDLPRQAEDYVHRIGRCGRAGRTGSAINLCSMDDRRQFFAINRYLGRKMATAVIEGLEPRRNVERSERSFDDKNGKKRRGQGRGGQRFDNHSDNTRFNESGFGKKRFDDKAGFKKDGFKVSFKDGFGRKDRANKDYADKGFKSKEFKSDKGFKADKSFADKEFKTDFKAKDSRAKDSRAKDGFAKPHQDKFKKESGFFKDAKFKKGSDKKGLDKSFDKRHKDDKFAKSDKKSKAGVKEFVFNQTAKKSRRFGDK